MSQQVNVYRKLNLHYLGSATVASYFDCTSEGTSYSGALSTSTSGLYGLRHVTTFALATAGSTRAISGEVSYSAGYATPIGVAGKVTLTGAYSGVGYMWGVQGQIQFDGGSSLAGSQVAAGRFVLTETGTVTYTSGNVACIYADNLITSPMASESGGTIDIVRLANHGGQIDNMINFYGDFCTNLFRLDTCDFVSANTVAAPTFANWRKITLDIDGTTHYLIAAQTIT